MRSLFRLILCITFFSVFGLPAHADDGVTPDSVRSLTRQAVAVLQKEDVGTARQHFMNDGPFRRGQIYVNVIDTNGTWVIYPPNPRNEGRSVLNVRDADGKLLVQEILAVAASPAHEGWVKYRWLNPESNHIEQKMSYVMAVPGKTLVTYIGLYYNP